MPERELPFFPLGLAFIVIFWVDRGCALHKALPCSHFTPEYLLPETLMYQVTPVQELPMYFR